MADSGSPGAKAGNFGQLKNVLVGQPGFQGTGYGFTGNSVITVKSSSSLNPGSAPFQFTVHVTFTRKPSKSVGDYDLLRKGLSSTKGGDFKGEILGSGKAMCYFKGSSGSKQVTGSASLADGKWHTIQCIKDDAKVTLVVDGKATTSSARIGSISNSAPLAIGAKAQGGDWYSGLMDEVSFSIGGSSPAPAAPDPAAQAAPQAPLQAIPEMPTPAPPAATAPAGTGTPGTASSGTPDTASSAMPDAAGSGAPEPSAAPGTSRPESMTIIP